MISSDTLAIEHVAIGTLRPAEYNPRTMSDKARAALKRGIETFGLVDPIIARRSDHLVIGGHQRLSAAKELKLATVPVVFIDVDDQQAAALNVLLNNPAAQGEWDFALLSGLLSDLDANGYDATLTGFDDEALAKMLSWTPDPENGLLGGVDPDAVPDVPKEPITKPGDLILLGRHRLVCGDSTDALAWESVMAGGVADMVWTDPPYGVAFSTDHLREWDGGKKRARDAVSIANDALKPAALADFLRGSLSLALVHTRAGGSWYVAGPALAGPAWAFVTTLYDLGVFRQMLVWVKESFVLGRSDYHGRFEALFYGWKEGGAHYFVDDRTQDTVWEIPRPKRSAEHPTMKPVALVQRAIENSSLAGQIVADPFGGSGTTLLACEVSGRTARLIELSPAYCDVIVTRWEAATGKTAVRHGS